MRVRDKLVLGALASAIFLSLAIKHARIDFNDALDGRRLARDIKSEMEAAGYAAQIVLHPSHPSIVKARKGSCEIWLRDATVHGHQLRALYRKRLGSAGSVRFAYNGEWRDDYPSLRIELLWRWQRELGRIGIDMPIKPILAVAASDACRPPAQIFASARIHLVGQ